MVDDELFEKGLKTRTQVLGTKYVKANLAASDDFMMTFQRAVTNWRGAMHGAARDSIRRRGAS
jgi:hypothetical protein